MSSPRCAACDRPLDLTDKDDNPAMAWSDPAGVVVAAHRRCLACFPGLEFLALEIRR